MMIENKISYVLNVSCTCARPEHLDDEHFRRIAVRDSNRENITPYLDEAVEFIGKIRYCTTVVEVLAFDKPKQVQFLAYNVYTWRDSMIFVKKAGERF